ncbi:MAG TPA: hypothetical protein VMW45_05305 [Dehalococcoidia bacterium]|nr:hypothetical protein [Dehalococcoidia bacterium]
MGAWNLKEFKILCLNSGFDKALFYTNSLAVKWNAAIYHKHNIQQKMVELNFNSVLAKGPAYDYEIAFELDALMLTLNSMWDILGQLINECFIRPKIPASDVYFDKILNRYLNSIPPEIQDILKPIQGNKHYHTIRAFANVSKHRHVIPGEIHMDFSDKPAQKSYVITELEYNGEWYKLTLADGFECWKFVNEVGKSVDQVGAKIHKLMK